MAYIVNGAYDSTLRVPRFGGLNQIGEEISSDPTFATDCVGAQTAGGTLRPMAAMEVLPAAVHRSVRTLSYFHRRWYVEDTAGQDLLIGAAYGHLYWANTDGTEWNQIPMPETHATETFLSDAWSVCAYEKTFEENGDPVDILLMSNTKDGMFYLRGDTLTMFYIETPKKFGALACYNERIFGGAIESDPDMLVYSAAYDPMDWEQNGEFPEDGAGDVQLPTWDGDGFVGMLKYGTYLLCVKKDSIWRLSGTNPSEYHFAQQYGGGTVAMGSLCTDQTYAYMLGRNGLMRYNGETVSPLFYDETRELMESLNRDRLGAAVAVIYDQKYIIAFATGESRVNDTVLVYNMREGTVLIRRDRPILALVSTQFGLYLADANGSLLRWHDDCMEEGCSAVPMRWESPWVDCNYKNYTKGSFTLYATVDCKTPVVMRIGIQTEKRLKMKTLTFQPPPEGKKAKQRRVIYGGNGRRFRFMIESDGSIPWRMLGGLAIIAETDQD